MPADLRSRRTSDFWGISMNKDLKRIAVTVALIAAVSVWLTGTARADEAGADVKPVFAERLANVPGKKLTAVVVNYAPGGKAAPHRRGGSVFAYVLSGSIRSENSATGPVRVYKAGESFFEPAGSRHLVSENASTKEAASLLTVFIADDGARLTTFDK